MRCGRHRACRAPSHSLLWLVVAANVSVVVGALAVLASTTLTVSWPGSLGGGAALALLIGGTIALQTVLARRLLAPLGALWQHMQAVDPLPPGQRIDIQARSVEVADLVEAFNGMLDRLEEERRLSARRTEAAQQAERRWLSLELHDQIGQDLPSPRCCSRSASPVGRRASLRPRPSKAPSTSPRAAWSVSGPSPLISVRPVSTSWGSSAHSWTSAIASCGRPAVPGAPGGDGPAAPERRRRARARDAVDGIHASWKHSAPSLSGSH